MEVGTKKKPDTDVQCIPHDSVTIGTRNLESNQKAVEKKGGRKAKRKALKNRRVLESRMLRPREVDLINSRKAKRKETARSKKGSGT